MAQATWKTAVVAVVALAAGLVLGGSRLLDGVQAQSEGAAGGTICVLGMDRNGSAPIILVDTREQSLMVYEYSYGNNRIELTAARTYQYDKLLEDWQCDGPSVDSVRKNVTRR